MALSPAFLSLTRPQFFAQLIRKAFRGDIIVNIIARGSRRLRFDRARRNASAPMDERPPSNLHDWSKPDS